MYNSKLLKVLKTNLEKEDPYYHFANNTNPFQFYFNNSDYIIHLTAIHGWNKRPDMRRIQIKPLLRDLIIKKSSYDFIFVILGYDFVSKKFVSWPTNVLFSKFTSGKSLYTDINAFKQADEKGICYWNNNNIDSQCVIFNELSINEFLKNPKKTKLDFNNNSLSYLNLDYKTLPKSKFNKNVQNLDNQIFIKNNSNKKLSWDRTEYLVVLDIYFKLKNKHIEGDLRKNKYLINAHKLLLKRSNLENKIKRTLDSLYLRVQNFKACDNEWPGKGLDGGAGGRTKIIFNEFKHNESLLIKEVEEIYSKYEFEYSSDSVSNFVEYKKENLINSQITIPLKLIDEFIDAQNLKDRSTNIHIETLFKFYNYIKKIDPKPLFNSKSVDLYFKNKSHPFIVEVKSINQNNVKSQIRSAIIQLLEYEYFHKYIDKDPLFSNKNIGKIILLSQNPRLYLNKKLINSYFEMCKFYNIDLIFIENNDFLKIDNNKLIKAEFDG